MSTRPTFTTLRVEGAILPPALLQRVGGVGRSLLWRMFRLQRKTVNVPVALASDESPRRMCCGIGQRIKI